MLRHLSAASDGGSPSMPCLIFVKQPHLLLHTGLFTATVAYTCHVLGAPLCDSSVDLVAWAFAPVADAAGERLEWHLRDVMKQTDKTFRAKTKNFAAWEQRVKARRAQQREAAKAALGQQQQQSEADAIKAAILAADEGQQLAGSSGMQAEQQQQQQRPQQGQQQQQ